MTGYAMNLRAPQGKQPLGPVGQRLGRGLSRREEVAMDPAAALVPAPAPAADATVSAVTTVAPQMKRFRATATRTVTQTALVEFDALEGQDPYMLAEDVCAAVAPEQWTTSESDSWCSLSNLQDIGAAGTADPAAAADPAAPSPALAASRRRLAGRGLSRRMSAEEATAAVDEIAAQAAALVEVVAETVDDAQAQVDGLSTLAARVREMTTETIEDPDAGVAAAVAEQVTELANVIEEQLVQATETLSSMRAADGIDETEDVANDEEDQPAAA